MVQKQWWVNLPTSYNRSREWHQTVPKVTAFFTTKHSQWNKKQASQFLSRMSLVKREKKYHFFLHLHPRVHLFNILCDEMGSTHNTFPLHTNVQRMSRRKLNSYECMNWEQKPLWHWISGTHFLENEISLSLHGKQLTELDTNDKIQVFMWKW